MPKIKDLPESEIKVGMKIRSLINPDRTGIIVKIDTDDDNYAWVLWEGNDKTYGGFYGNDCECEVVHE